VTNPPKPQKEIEVKASIQNQGQLQMLKQYFNITIMIIFTRQAIDLLYDMQVCTAHSLPS
jgi:hypothetical protein